MTSHSPLGGSSSHRWIECPGSAYLANQMGVGIEEESEYAKEGTAAHEVAALCLRSGQDAWEVTTNVEEAEAVQVYLDHCRNVASDGTAIWQKIEEHVSRVDENEHLYGTVDHAVYMRDYAGGTYIAITDYKHGAGLIVEPRDNSQLMYYAYGLLPDDYDGPVILTIVQPRAFHKDGAVRQWPTTAKHIREWAQKVLLPAMKRTEFDDNLAPGSHCRFCPIRLICPALKGMAKAAASAEGSSIAAMTDAELGAEYASVEAVEIYLKAVKGETYKRLMAGTSVPLTKLVDKKSFRVWKDGAEQELATALGDSAYERSLRSPAELEKLGGEAKKLVAKFAFMPHNGYTVALEADNAKPSVKVQSSFAKKGK